jgi:hypothetical protein
MDKTAMTTTRTQTISWTGSKDGTKKNRTRKDERAQERAVGDGEERAERRQTAKAYIAPQNPASCL